MSGVTEAPQRDILIILTECEATVRGKIHRIFDRTGARQIGRSRAENAPVGRQRRDQPVAFRQGNAESSVNQDNEGGGADRR